MTNKKMFIYSLCEPDSLNIRYIGKTQNVKERYLKHLKDKANTHKVH